jgi:demethylmenaquinone methyltransferase/2-methoxy-6-polyprenyl-1,4-benzoquinol methylase
MFTHIAQRYDWFDHVASLGSDYLWRPRALWDLERYREHEPPVRRILDLGCGTGDLTQLAARRFPRAEVTGVDFTAAMLALADRRRRHERVAPRVRYARASALGLPFRDASFDVAMSAFVARNLPNLEAAIAEVRRVLVPGGTLLTLEITEPPSPMFRSLFHAYFDRVVPWLGAAVKSAGPYRYLPESLRYLPDRRGMRAMFERLGFERTEAYDQSMGIVTTYLARRSGDPRDRGRAS